MSLHSSVGPLLLSKKHLFLPALFLFCCCLQLIGCAATRRGTQSWVLLPTSMEVGIGQGVSQNVVRKYPVFENKEIGQYVQALGKKITTVCDRKDIVYQFTVLESPEINAFAAPGGYIFITSGLLTAADNEAEIVVVIGHEVGHVVARHGAQRIQAQLGLGIAAELSGLGKKSQLFQDMVGLGTTLAFQGYSRENELEADWYGALYASRLGYDPKAAVSLFNKLKKVEKNSPNLLEAWLASHPPSDARIKEYARIEPELPSRSGFLNRDNYLQKVSFLKQGTKANK
jgi:predicted Zn-dependent protease